MIGFVVLFVVMVAAAGEESELRWSRLVYLFGSAEAVVFAAVGWLFGSEVHRARAEGAEQQASDALSRSEELQAGASSARERGTALAAAIRAEGLPTAGRSSAEPFLGAEPPSGEEGSEVSEGVLRLRRLADELFPPT